MRVRRVYIFSTLCFWLFLSSSSIVAAPQKPFPPVHKSPFHLFFNIDSTYSESEFLSVVRLQKYFTRLEHIKSRSGGDMSFLRKVFFKTHRSFLRSYDAGATFPQTLKSGTYGCLSGTALYAMILEHFGYKYEIVELPSHVYLMVHLEENSLLIESTLPQDGFISDVTQIAKSTQQYAEDSRNNNSTMAISGLTAGSPNGDSNGKIITLSQLSGLQYYNMAIYNLGDKDYEQAYVNADRSLLLYPSKRTKRLMEIVINKILQSKSLSNDQKSGILNAYIAQVKKKRLTQR